MELLKKGTRVRTAAIVGLVVGMSVDHDQQELQYLVDYQHRGHDGQPEGDVQRRFFRPDELSVHPSEEEELAALDKRRAELEAAVAAKKAAAEAPAQPEGAKP